MPVGQPDGQAGRRKQRASGPAPPGGGAHACPVRRLGRAAHSLRTPLRHPTRPCGRRPPPSWARGSSTGGVGASQCRRRQGTAASFRLAHGRSAGDASSHPQGGRAIGPRRAAHAAQAPGSAGFPDCPASRDGLGLVLRQPPLSIPGAGQAQTPIGACSAVESRGMNASAPRGKRWRLRMRWGILARAATGPANWVRLVAADMDRSFRRDDALRRQRSGLGHLD